VRELNRRMAAGELTPADAADALQQWSRVEEVLGVGETQETPVPPEILALLEARQAARKARDFARADALRQQLRAAGWFVEDTPKGPRLKRIQA